MKKTDKELTYRLAPIKTYTAREDGDGEEEQEQENEANKPFTHEQMAQTSRMMAAMLKKKLNSGEYKKTMAEMISSAVGNAFESLDISALAGKKEEGSENKQSSDVKESSEYKALLARLEKQEKRAAELEAAREEEANRLRIAQERSALSDALIANGVPKEKLRGAMALLLHEEKAIGRSEDGQIRYLRDHGDYVEELPVVDGVRAFLETSEGKAYLPPIGAQGSEVRDSGNQRTKRRMPKASGKQTKEEAMSVIAEFIGGGAE